MQIDKKLKIPPGAAVFDKRADEYDGWFESSLLFDIELATLKDLLPLTKPPAIEIGVGPGRFAAALGTKYGLDPALSALQLAKGRDIIVINGLGDSLPIKRGSIKTVWLLFTLCFLENAQQVLQECSRILTPAGDLVVGFIPADSAWGVALRKKGEANHPYYCHAQFYTPLAVKTMLKQNGFSIRHSRSSLFQGPDCLEKLETPQSGIHAHAGFCAVLAKKDNPVT